MSRPRARRGLAALALLIGLGGSAPAGAAQDPGAPQGGAPGGDAPPAADVDVEAVARLLQQRCAECHVPGAEDARAARKWSGALDLATTVADPDLVVPGEPDESELYNVAAFEEMPPEDSGLAFLDEGELALLHGWIAAGAPAEAAGPGDAQGTDGGAGGTDAAPDGGDDGDGIGGGAAARPKPALTPAQVVGRLHPTLVHFPIALLLAALLAELLGRLRRSDGLRTAATFCLTLGALASVPTAAAGWLLAEATTSGGDVDRHRWTGVATAALALVVLAICLRKPRLRLPLLVVLAALVAFAGHTGGALVYGEDWLPLPF